MSTTYRSQATNFSAVSDFNEASAALAFRGAEAQSFGADHTALLDDLAAAAAQTGSVEQGEEFLKAAYNWSVDIAPIDYPTLSSVYLDARA